MLRFWVILDLGWNRSHSEKWVRTVLHLTSLTQAWFCPHRCASESLASRSTLTTEEKKFTFLLTITRVYITLLSIINYPIKSVLRCLVRDHQSWHENKKIYRASGMNFSFCVFLLFFYLSLTENIERTIWMTQYCVFAW